MISIKQYEETWLIEIKHEVWAFDTIEELKSNLNSLLALKLKYGNIKD